MKKFFASMIVVLVAVMFVTGGAFAWDDTEHVSVAANGKGDVLIFPHYIALSGGWNTKLVVTNTSFTECVVAKVIVRGGIYSQEVLDFFIYLSPTDVWTGELNYGPDGARLYSEDDSCRGGSRAGFVGWASATNPWDCTLLSLCSNELEEMGYVEVIEAWTADLGNRPVGKSAIKSAYDDDVITEENFESVINSLTGHYEHSYYPGFFAAGRATALRNYNIVKPLLLGVETFLGGSDSRNSLCEVEAALSKNRLAMPYYAKESANATLHLFNFPTKLSTLGSDCAYLGARGPYFDQNGIIDTDDCIRYGATYIDLQENSQSSGELPSPIPPSEAKQFCWELEWFEVEGEFVYDEGWANYQFDGTTSCEPQSSSEIEIFMGYTGVPVIADALIVTPDCGMTLVPAAFTDGRVDYDEVENVDYQWEYAAPGKLPSDY